ncbi:sensor histidine kinase [Clostridium sp. B9]|uniref:sensor histidine kinase n=1 Tax=Clostridium sp. B9 TaxID=3423224 RepID=UPI003D2F44CD
MKSIVIVFFLFVVIVLLMKLFLMKKDIKNINDSLELIKNKNTNKRITSLSMNKDIVSLINEINFVLDDRDKEKLYYEKNNKNIKAMITNISHDLRTPLTSIKGYIQYVNNRDMDKEDIQAYLNIVNEKAIVLQELLDSFFELANIEEKKYPIEIEEVNINKVLTDIVLSFYEDFNMKNIEPKVMIQEENIVALADKRASKRVLVNLIQNVLKHAEKEVIIELYCDEKNVFIEFQNKALNIRKEDVEFLHNRFFTVDKSRSSKNNGLGLAIAKELTEQMNGSFDISLKNENLRFKVSFSRI